MGFITPVVKSRLTVRPFAADFPKAEIAELDAGLVKCAPKLMASVAGRLPSCA
jgi:hypothetical protein